MTNAINTEIAARLREVAGLLDEQGANQFRIRAYKRAAETMRSLKRPVDKLIKASGVESLQELPGIGKGLARSIQQFVTTGRLPMLDRLRGESETLRRLGALARTGPYIAQAPLAIVVVIERTKFSVSDASRAIQSMILTAWSEGIVSNWVGFFDLDGARPLLGIPDDLDVLAIVPFGYPVRAVGKGRKQRKPLNEVAYRGRFGQPL